MLALERIGHRIHDLLNNGSWSQLSFGRGIVVDSLSHMMFECELIMIVEATTDQAYLIDILFWMIFAINLVRRFAQVQSFLL